MNEINKENVYSNVIAWVCNTDGYDYAIGGILGNLPCPFVDLNMCYKFNAAMDEAIGGRIEINVHNIIMCDADEFNKLHNFAYETTERIVRKYNEFVKNSESPS